MSLLPQLMHSPEIIMMTLCRNYGSALMVTQDVGEAVYLSDRVFVLSARPSKLLADITIDLPRPRTHLETRRTQRFVELQAEVLERVEEAGRVSGHCR